MAGRLQHLDLERSDTDAVSIAGRDAVVGHRGETGGVELRSGACRQFRETAGEVRVRVAVEDGHDAQAGGCGVGEVVVHVAFGVDDGGLTVRSEQIRGVGEAFDEVAFEIHGVSFRRVGSRFSRDRGRIASRAVHSRRTRHIARAESAPRDAP